MRVADRSGSLSPELDDPTWIEGVDTTNTVDNDRLDLWVYPAGKHSYESAGGALRTVRRFATTVEQALKLSLPTAAPGNLRAAPEGLQDTVRSLRWVGSPPDLSPLQVAIRSTPVHDCPHKAVKSTGLVLSCGPLTAQ